MTISFTCTCPTSGITKEDAIAKIMEVKIIDDKKIIIIVKMFWSQAKFEEGISTAMSTQEFSFKKADDLTNYNAIVGGNVITKAYDYLLTLDAFSDGEIV